MEGLWRTACPRDSRHRRVCPRSRWWVCVSAGVAVRCAVPGKRSCQPAPIRGTAKRLTRRTHAIFEGQRNPHKWHVPCLLRVFAPCARRCGERDRLRCLQRAARRDQRPAALRRKRRADRLQPRSSVRERLLPDARLAATRSWRWWDSWAAARRGLGRRPYRDLQYLLPRRRKSRSRRGRLEPQPLVPLHRRQSRPRGQRRCERGDLLLLPLWKRRAAAFGNCDFFRRLALLRYDRPLCWRQGLPPCQRGRGERGAGKIYPRNAVFYAICGMRIDSVDCGARLQLASPLRTLQPLTHFWPRTRKKRAGLDGNNGKSAERMAVKSTNRSRNDSDFPLRQPTDQKAGGSNPLGYARKNL